MATAPESSKRDRSHARILDVAAKLVRARGLEGAGVDRVMGAAGLTRGGFYAHFADKAAMIAEALDVAFAQSHRNMFATDATGLAWLERTTALYLSRSHVEGVEAGCAVPALAPEVRRSSPEVRAAFARNVERVLQEIATRLGEDRPKAAARREAMAVFATWVGALAIARAVDGPLGDEVLEAARDEVLAAGRSKRSEPRGAKQSGEKPASTKPARRRARSSSTRSA